MTKVFFINLWTFNHIGINPRVYYVLNKHMLWTKSKSQSIIYLKTLSSVQTRRVPTFFLPLEALNASIDKLAGSLLADSYDWFIIYCALCLNIYLIAIAAKDKGGTNIGHIFLLHYILCPLPVSHVLLQFAFMMLFAGIIVCPPAQDEILCGTLAKRKMWKITSFSL